MPDDFPLQPVLAQSPQLSTPEAVSSPGTFAAEREQAGAAFMGSAGALAVERGVNSAYADSQNGNTIVPHDKAVQFLKSRNYDSSGVPSAGWSEGALMTEMQRQERAQGAELAASRANLSDPARIVSGMVGGLGDPILLAAGPVLGRFTGALEAPLAARAAIGGAEGAGIVGGEEALQNHLTGHDEDSLSWTMLRDMTLSAAPGALLHSAFGPRALARPGDKVSLDIIDQLERSDAAAKAQGVTADQVVSPAGAVGRYQIMSSTARGFGLKGDDAEIAAQLKDPAVNRTIATKALDELAVRYGNDPEAIAVAYNAGPRMADQWIKGGRDDRFLPNETRAYLSRLRGATWEDRTNAAQLSLAQVNDDTPVDVGPVADFPRPKINAFTIADEHDAEVHSLMAQAWIKVMERPEGSMTDKGMDEAVRQVIEPEQKTANPELQTYQDAHAAAQERVAGLGPDALQQFKERISEEERQPEVGTLLHDEVTKAVQAAVNCGMMKGVDYAAE